MCDLDIAFESLGEIVIIITNDQAMFTRAEKRDLDPRWGTSFLLQAFLECGISQEQFEEGRSGYLKDVYLPKKAQQQVLNVQKQDDS